MKLSSKMILSFCGVILIMLALSGVSMKNLSDINSNIEEVDKSWLPSVIAIQGMNQQLYSVRADLLGMMLHDGTEEMAYYKDHIDETVKGLRENGNRYKTLLAVHGSAADGKNRQLFEEITASLNTIAGIRDRVVAMVYKLSLIHI